jgi:hypothetical protein
LPGEHDPWCPGHDQGPSRDQPAKETNPAAAFGKLHLTAARAAVSLRRVEGGHTRRSLPPVAYLAKTD